MKPDLLWRPIAALLVAGLSFMALPVAAQETTMWDALTPEEQQKLNTESASERVISLVVYGEDKCPQGKGNEIVICARKPENERYRLPKRFRDQQKQKFANSAWGPKVADLERTTSTGLPTSCTTSGSNGISGCYHQFIMDSIAERQQRKTSKYDDPDNE
ncbi:MAG: hypothetical protein ABF760_01220 [Zymomonas mobilis]|uniref:Uncharacterized protein n=1 Tax=Zymomonas mobilis TaxID=542 RepID=A0A542W322_ZYMMB|nr:hypothetical protein [Zymomonas mobilis]TQL17974.1 hypothetical protein FBY58_1588 [Zymomonas mobilis]